MPTQRERKNKIEFYVNDEEKSFILEKMKVAKIKNLSAYFCRIRGICAFRHMFRYL